MSTSSRTQRSASKASGKRNGRPPADSVDVTNAIRMDGHLADENDLLRQYAETHDPRLKEELVKRLPAPGAVPGAAVPRRLRAARGPDPGREPRPRQGA